MFGKPLDDSTVDRLLNGLMHPEDAPPSLARAAGLVRAAKAPAQASELVGREHAVATMSAAVRAVPSIQVSKGITRLGRKAIGRKTMIGKISAKLLSAKVAAGVAAVVVAGGGAAAATGSLPSSIQKPLSSALSHVGISIPKPSSSSGSGTTQSSSTTSSTSGSNSTSTSSTATSHNAKAVGPTASGASAYGLCHAYAATKGNTSANDIALRNLSDAAQKAGMSITKFCSSVTPGFGSRPSGVGGGKPSGVGSGSSSAGAGASAGGSVSSHASGTGKPSGVGSGSSSTGAGASAGGSVSSHASGTGPATTSTGVSGHGASSISAGGGSSIR